MLIDDINGSTVAPVVASTQGQRVIFILTFCYIMLERAMCE